MYDVIIVGARVAGSASAMLLARRGLRVLALDRATFPSDTLSTNNIQVPGVGRLARWGLLDAVLDAGTPPVRTISFDNGVPVIRGTVPSAHGVDFVCGPRRTVLDTILVDAARAAGAEIRENFVVEEFSLDDTGVTVAGREKGGARVTERGRFLIGADGRNSMVARTVEAPAYREAPSRTVGYYGYWAGLPLPGGGELYGRPGLAVGMWPTNDDLTMVYTAFPVARFAEIRTEPEAHMLAALDAVGVGERIRSGRRVERLRGTPELPSFFRRPDGPRWALAGDAGLTMDPITAFGINDALRDADLLTDALVDGLGGTRPLDRALRDFRRTRDAQTGPMYDFTRQLAGLDAPTPGEIGLFAALAADPAAADRFVGAITGAVPLPEFMSPGHMIRLVGVRGFGRLVAGGRRRS